jgi:hypothetical protein
MTKKKSGGRDTSGRFQAGHTGNPTGRPRKAKTVGAAVAGAFAEKVQITENGKRRRVTKLDVAAKQIANRSAAGDPRMVKLGFELAQKAQEGEERTPFQPEHLSESDQQIAARLIERIRKIIEEGNHGSH